MERFRGVSTMYDEMNGLQVLWSILTNWEEGKGLWMIIGLAMIAVTLSIISDKYLDNDDVIPPTEQYPL